MIAGVLVRHIGPALFFPVAGGLVAVAILGGLTQREFREFGARTEGKQKARVRQPRNGRNGRWAETTLRSAKKKKAATWCGGDVRYGGMVR